MTKTNRPAHPAAEHILAHGMNMTTLEWDILRGITRDEADHYGPYDFFDDGVTEGSGIWSHWADEVADWLPVAKATARRAIDSMASKGILDAYLDEDSDGRGKKSTWYSLTEAGAQTARWIAQVDTRTLRSMARTDKPAAEAAKPSTDTGRTNTSHAGHDHPATSKARAACRKAQAAKA